MDGSSFDALTRRASLRTLGLTGLAVVAPGAGASAQGAGSKFKRCKKQAEFCTPAVLAKCDGDPDCADATSCCAHLEECHFDDFLVCVIAATNPTTAATFGRGA